MIQKDFPRFLNHLDLRRKFSYYRVMVTNTRSSLTQGNKVWITQIQGIWPSSVSGNQLGMRQSCQHIFEHNRYVKESRNYASILNNEALTAADWTNPSKHRDTLIEQSVILITITKPLLL